MISGMGLVVMGVFKVEGGVNLIFIVVFWYKITSYVHHVNIPVI